MDREKVIKALEYCRNKAGCWSDESECPWIAECREDVNSLKDATLALLKEQESTLGMRINAESIEFTATGDAKQGEERGFMLGKSMMYEHIEKELLYAGILTDEIRGILNRVRMEL